jgi:hypothetical protein
LTIVRENRIVLSEPDYPGLEQGNRPMNRFDPLGTDQASACLHVARDLVLAQVEGERGPRKRKLKNIEAAVLDAIGSVARQGLTAEEFQAAAAKMRSGAYGPR